jgi:hypothetical protein
VKGGRDVLAQFMMPDFLRCSSKMAKVKILEIIIVAMVIIVWNYG